MDTVSAVQLSGVEKHFGSTRVLEATDLAVADGEFLVIVGPSGCGKSTLLRLIAGLEKPDHGRIMIGDRDVTDVAPAERGLAMVFQSYALYPHLTVAENIGFPLKVANMRKAHIAERVATVAATLDLSELLARRPRALSGGQRQRVSIARAIVRQPQVLLLDEPLSNLDTTLRVKMRHELARLHQQLGTTMIYVTHDQLEAMTLANRIVVMSNGRIEQVGVPMELYHRPASLAVATAIGSPGINLMRVTVVAADAGNVRVRLPDGAALTVAARMPAAAIGGSATLGIRPEHLHIDEDGQFEGAVELFERLGPLSFAHLGARGEAGTVVAQLPGDRVVTLGERLRVGVLPSDARLFDAGGRAFPLSP